MLSVAFVDSLGLCYDGSTLTKRGLGGSESAVILITKELALLGFDVTVFNDCTHDDASPGIYDGVLYRPIHEVETTTSVYDVVVGSRSVAAFAPVYIKDRFKTFTNIPDFTNIQKNSKHKVLWMHDTFCDGDDLIDTFLLEGHINEIFVLSDFHLDYVTNCDHGKKRMFEVMKKYMYATRNGVTKYRDWVDISKKDPNHFVYNSSVTKGMRPLVNKIWPKIREQIPEARLSIIGGYYRMREGLEPDQQEIEWRQLVDNNPDINFTGIIRQSEIADILCDASYMIYPCDFPETFGISTLESLTYNTPVITCDFGALEETAFDNACYKIPFPVVPNGLFPYINEDDQVEKFVQMTLEAHRDKYLHQQKMYACNSIKNICGWDSVALQWKQHFYKKLGEYLPVDDYRKVQHINYKTHKAFGRRFTNEEEFQEPRGIQRDIVVISPVYNAEQYIVKCINSVACQDYDNYTMHIIDDCSTDNTVDNILRCVSNLPDDIQNKFNIIRNNENKGAVYNQVNIIRDNCKAGDIIMLLDGDDWLVNDPNIFHKYNNIYSDGTEFTYGSCWSIVDNIPLVAQPYPPEVKANKSYRQYKFNWNMPYTHLRTFLADLLFSINQDDLLVDGLWPKAGGDTSLFYALLEKADPNLVACVPEVVYNYNDGNPLNDYKVNAVEQNQTASKVMGKTSNMKQYSVVIPTMWKYGPFLPFLNNLLDCSMVSEVILIDNDPRNTPHNLPQHPKLKYHTFGTNIFVNPAWNYGVECSTNDYICIANDDIEFDLNVFTKLANVLEDDRTGVCGITPGLGEFNQIPITDGAIDIVPWQEGMHQFGYGCLMFINKNNWKPIPEELKIYYGDYFIFDNNLFNGRTNHCITNMKHNTPYAQTCEQMYIDQPGEMKNMQQHEEILYAGIKGGMQHTKEFTPPVSIPEVIDVPKQKTILIAIPTNKNIESATFKSIYDLEVPNGYKTELQFFYGYQIDQIRNLIAEWGKKHDYLFCVDSDIVLPRDALMKLVGWDKDIVSGLYIQRIHGRHTVEVYENVNGDIVNISWENIKQRLGLLEIAACGFGCVLIKGEVLRRMEYPHFVYKSAINHAHTFSEDVYFCTKAKEVGFSTWCDTTLLCEHVGQYIFKVDEAQPKAVIEYIRDEDRLPREQVEYLHSISDLKPKVVYDIGACVLHWERHAKQAWPSAQFVLFDAEPGVERILRESGHQYHIGVLTDVDGRSVDFYHHLENPGGNSYYKEITPGWEQHKSQKIGYTLDTIVQHNNFPLPDLIKLDIQGAEIDVLRGAQKCIEHCTDIILEAQHKTYNEGAPCVEDVIKFMDSIGFDLIKNINKVEYDGDYHFKKKSTNPDKPKGIPEVNVPDTSFGPTKAFIIQTINDNLSEQYAQSAIESCKLCGIIPSVWMGPNAKEDGCSIAKLSENTNVKFGQMNLAAACASASHFTLWMHIAEMKDNDPVIILEHDSLLLHPIKSATPINWDHRIIALGYKTTNPKEYDYVNAGPTRSVALIKRHSGAHAYMITPNTARELLRELSIVGAPRAIDNFYFMRVNDPGDTESSIPLCIADPIAAIGWIRQSTIWTNSSTLNYDCISSYTDNLKSV